ncbi:hypothetical protein GCM10025781_07910 [Kocuria gwangalliensis]|uniref:Uncharacterized protein n=1 Tax=Kocuria gwangalliensis TaxID=501592 RepID=A0ABP8WRU3_9MICC
MWVAWAPASTHHWGPTAMLATPPPSHWMANEMMMNTPDTTGTDQFPYTHFWSLFTFGYDLSALCAGEPTEWVGQGRGFV